MAEDIAELQAVCARLSRRSIDTLTHPDVAAALDGLEDLHRRLPAQSHRLIARLQRETTPQQMGASTWKKVLATRLRISSVEAARRLTDATELGPRTTLTGQPMEPLRAHTATAQAEGRINREHVEVVRTFFKQLPNWVDVATRKQAERTLIGKAARKTPDALRKSAARLALLIDQDGPEPDDAERARKRSLTLGPQGADGYSRLSGDVSPELRAHLEPVLAKLGAPGMCNPDDPEPRISGTPTQAQIDSDGRNMGQRNHDAVVAVLRDVLTSGELGQHNGLPVTVIASTTVQDLLRAAGLPVTGKRTAGTGSAVTAGGTLLDMRTLIRLASHAMHYLLITDEHTAIPLYLGRDRRIASAGQRIVLLNRDRGCTFPGCHVPGNGCQVHHVNGWATKNGQTNVDEEVLACPGDNRLAEQGWTVKIRDGVVEWIPPPELDVGQDRTNDYFHPDRLLGEPDDDPREADGSDPDAA